MFVSVHAFVYWEKESFRIKVNRHQLVNVEYAFAASIKIDADVKFSIIRNGFSNREFEIVLMVQKDTFCLKMVRSCGLDIK